MQSGLALPFQGDCWGGTYPPRCGGLLCNAPKGAGKNFQFYGMFYRLF
ncbi:MAG: hypothetical protein LBL62_03835 [Planctomycetaceae bacterium]|nr:hypothetical protein [Planctomycetaceae bacterium]